jgi:hypothetical protein
MGITHFSDLRPSQALKFLQAAWHTSLKLDGSFVQFGLDEAGRFYTARKQGDPYYDVDEWPDMPWCNSFRSAHALLEGMIDAMREVGTALPGDRFEAEIIWGKRPNTILYPDHSNAIVITRAPKGVFNGDHRAKQANKEWLELYCGGTAMVSVWHTEDGVNLHKRAIRQKWSVGVVRRHILQTSGINNLYNIHLDSAKRSMCKDMENWFHSGTQFEGANVLALLECRLNSRPEWVPLEMWRSPASHLLKAQIKYNRDKLRSEYAQSVRQISHSLTNFIAQAYGVNNNSDFEGFVVEGSGITCKFVNRTDFSKANKLSHWVRYVLQGGSRPPRSCFVSRTKDWPIERRLARLETLRLRYLKYRHRLDFYGKNVTVSYMDSELHQRTLLLFAELRVRISNGW